MSVIRVQNRYLVSIYRHAANECEVALSEYQVCHTPDEVAALLSEEPAGSGFIAIVECRCIKLGGQT